MHSQNNEEKYILNYFGKSKGTFLDLGSNDGIIFSNTYALAERGWKGVLVDASPKAFAQLEANYAGRHGFALFNLAITDREGPMTFMESGPLIGDKDIGLVSTFKGSEVERFYKTVQYEEIAVMSVTWKTFLDLSPEKHFDFISMDVEGSELDILPHMDLSKTRMLCIESNGREDLKLAYEKYLVGFNLIHRTPENLIYAR